MKKFFSLLIIFNILFTPFVCAADNLKENDVKRAKVSKSKKSSMTRRINDICDRLREKNKIATKVRIRLRKTSRVNAYANIYKEIVVFSGLVKICENDDELAGIIAHELGHIVNAHVYRINIANNLANASIRATSEIPAVAIPAMVVAKVGLKKRMRLDEYESDVTAVDFLVGAGYNPLGMVSILQRITGDKYIDFLSTHPSGEKRTLYIYDYIAKAYPEYIEQGFDTESYEEFLIYYEDVAKERAQNPEKMIKHEKKFEKLEEKRKKKYAKYQRKWIRQEEKQRQKELDKIKEEQAD